MLFWVLGFLALAVQGSADRSVELWSEHPIVVTVEWLTIDARGEAVVHDRRDIAVDTRAAITYTPGTGQFLRFSYAGASPHSYATSELGLYRSMRVPDALPGGELLLLVAGATVRPAALEIRGPRVVTPQISSQNHTRLAGVPAGAYQVTPLYEGGLRGATYPVDVRDAGSTIAPLPIEAVGAVDLSVDRSVCDAATEMSLDLLVTPAHETDDDAPPMRAPMQRGVAPRCHGLIAGLPPGRLEVSYSGSSGGLGHAVVNIEPQAITSTTVTSSSIRVTGRLTLNGKPVANTPIGFMPADASIPRASRTAETITDAGGYYAVTLGSRGRYQLSMASSGGMMLSAAVATFTEPINSYDVALTGGTVVVTVEGWDGKRRLTVQVEGRDRSAMLGWRLEGPMTRSFSALPFGDYTVRVAGTRIEQRVTISAVRPETTVTLDLSQR